MDALGHMRPFIFGEEIKRVYEVSDLHERKVRLI